MEVKVVQIVVNPHTTSAFRGDLIVLRSDGSLWTKDITNGVLANSRWQEIPPPVQPSSYFTTD